MVPNPTKEIDLPLEASRIGISDGSFPSAEAPARPSRFRPRFLSFVTVEPALLFLAMTMGMEEVFKTNMFVDKTCAIQLHYSADVCSNLDSGNYETQQDATQKLTANYNVYCEVIDLLPGALVTLLLGYWSDTRGRLVPLLIPLAGTTLKALLLCCNAYWWSLQPWYVLFAYVPSGLGGGRMACFMAAYAFLSAITSPRVRTARISLAGMALLAGMPLGNMVGAVSFSYGGYVAVFGIEFIIAFVSFLYAMIRLPYCMPVSTAATTEERRPSPFKQLWLSLKVVARRRPAGGRARILCHTACVVLYMVTLGANSFMFLYTRKQFAWDYKKYTVWSTVNSVLIALASSFVLPVLSLHLGVEDSLVGFISSTSHCFLGVLVGTAPDPVFLYIALVPSSLGSLTISCSRGALSKLVVDHELGAVFSVVGLFESLGPVVTSPIYTLVYDNTLELFPGTVFLIAGGVSLIISCIYTWLLTAFLTPALPGSRELTLEEPSPS